MFNLKGKVALVVGGRGRLGSSFCKALAAQGVIVISADISDLKTGSKIDGIEDVSVDVTDPDSVNHMVDHVLSTYQRIDILVYTVTGKSLDAYSPYTDSTLKGWRHITQIELDGLFLMSQAVGRVMEKQKGGNMVFVSSIYGLVANDHRIYAKSNLDKVYNPNGQQTKRMCSPAVYNVVKAGVISLARYLAAYWAEAGIRVNVITPGGVSHPDENKDFVEAYSNRVPMGRKAEINEMDGALLYLVSDTASYVTGHNLVVDGGWTIW